MNVLQALMMRSLDYAGLFPPAKLPLQRAVREFADILQDEHEWLLARFVLPAGRAGDFAQEARSELAEASKQRVPWHLTGLMRSSPSIDEALDLLRSELQLLRGVLDTHPDALVLDSCELPLPDEVIHSHDQELARSFFHEAYRIFDERQIKTPVFWEVNLNNPFEHIALAAHNLNLLDFGRVCLKFRTGGLTPVAIASPSALAHAFKVATHHRVPFKLTAGLHLALRHFDAAVGAEAFGFLNVFTAAVLNWTCEFSETELRLLLEEKSCDAIEFSKEGVTWKNYSASIADIRHVRSVGLKSFGSCSFYEPIEDLKALKLLS